MSQAAAFYREVAEHRIVWALRDAGGYPTSGQSMPFWSSKARVEKIVAMVPAYKGFIPIGLTWDEFVAKWIPGLKRDGCLVGVNWSGARALGYDLEPDDVAANVSAAIERGQP